jgi:hypothetical protein
MGHYRTRIGSPEGEIAVANFARMTAFAALGTACAIGALAAAVQATPIWMTEQAMRGAFIGNTLDGQYVSGERWTETYTADGRLDYRESIRKGLGYWYFRGGVFCTFYDPGQGLNGGCFTAVQPSANCYEFYLAGLSDHEADREETGPLRTWIARAWRRGEPSTCEARPSV